MSSEALVETGRARPVPTMMPGAVIPPAAVPSPDPQPIHAPLAPMDGSPRSLARNQTIRHLATQHALTHHREQRVELEQLLRTAIAIERYIRSGRVHTSEQGETSDPEGE